MMQTLYTDQSPATLGFIKAFATKCKRLFQINPICKLADTASLWIKIQTNIPLAEFDDIYFNIKCIGETQIETNIYISSVEGLINTISGLNLGTDEVTQAILVLNESDSNNIKLDIILKLSSEFNNCIVNLIAASDDTLLYSPILDIDFLDEYEKPNMYWWSYNNESESEDGDLIPKGWIYNQVSVETEFFVQEDEESDPEPYTLGKVFTKIYLASEANKLSHDLTFQYNWENEAEESDEPINIGNLQEDEVVTIPVPKGLVNLLEEDGEYNTVEVYDGKIVSVSNNPVSINLASQDSVGGIKLGADSLLSYEDGRLVWVRLDPVTGKAFIDKNDVKGASSSDANWITTEEIDYLFKTHVDTVTIDSTCGLTILDTPDLHLQILPSDAYYTTITWVEVVMENNEEVRERELDNNSNSILVNRNGQLIAFTEGEIYIRCKVYDGEQTFRSNICHVTVTALQPVDAE